MRNRCDRSIDSKCMKESLIMIHEYCKHRGPTTKSCDGCVFEKLDGFCMIGAPILWDVKELKKELGIG